MSFVGPGELVRLRSVTIMKFDPRNPGDVKRFFLLNASLSTKNGDRVRFDVTRSQTVTRSWRKTNRPVSAGRIGATYTDHVRKNLDRITLRGTLTDTPLGVEGLITNPFQSRGLELYNQLVAIADEREPVFVATSRGYHPSMVILAISEGKHSQSGAAIDVSVDLEEAKIAAPLNASDAVDLDSVSYGAESVADAGTQSTDAAGLPADFTDKLLESLI